MATEEDVRDAIFRSFGAYDDLGEIVGEAVRGVDTEGLKLSRAEDEEQPVNVVELKEVVEGAPVIKLANALMTRAISMRATWSSRSAPPPSAGATPVGDATRS